MVVCSKFLRDFQTSKLKVQNPEVIFSIKGKDLVKGLVRNPDPPNEGTHPSYSDTG
jgi:hypothetical protein